MSKYHQVYKCGRGSVVDSVSLVYVFGPLFSKNENKNIALPNIVCGFSFIIVINYVLQINVIGMWY